MERQPYNISIILIFIVGLLALCSALYATGSDHVLYLVCHRSIH